MSTYNNANSRTMAAASISSSSSPDFESHGDRIEPFDDGHVPETFRGTAGVGTESRMLRPRNAASAAEVHVYDRALDPRLARALYRATASSPPSAALAPDRGGAGGSGEGLPTTSLPPVCWEGESPWGTYVTVEEARSWLEWREGRDDPGGSQGREFTSANGGACDPDGDDDENVEAWTKRWEARHGCWIEWRRRGRFSEIGTPSGAEASCDDLSYEFSPTEEKKNDTARGGDGEGGEDPRGVAVAVVPPAPTMDDIRHALAVEAVAQFFLQTIPSCPGSTAVASSSSPPPSSRPSSSQCLYSRRQFVEDAHGVAVWALSSAVGDSVRYHVDYAELLRYEHNVTVPPLWAGTIQCAPLVSEEEEAAAAPTSMLDSGDARDADVGGGCAIMRGGEFCVNLRGLDHYAEHGYKGNRSGDPAGGWTHPPPPADGGAAGVDPDRRIQRLGGGVRVDDASQWVTVPYAFCRGIVHTGDLPHLSTPVESVGRINDGGAAGGPSAAVAPTRVILGFNAFGHGVGPRVAEAPEHSRKFRRRVRLRRMADATSMKGRAGGIVAGGPPGGAAMVDVNDIRKNRGLTKLLVLAKREKVKEGLRRAQGILTRDVRDALLRRHRDAPPRRILRVMDLMDALGNRDDGDDASAKEEREAMGGWPRPADVQVHVTHMLAAPPSTSSGLEGDDSGGRSFRDDDGVAGVPGAWYRIVVVVDGDDGSGDDRLLRPETRLGVERANLIK